MVETVDTTKIDVDFKAFCAELKSEKPDMSIIKNGIEKYGFGQLSDTQKAEFMKVLFPCPIPEGVKESSHLGLQNLKGIDCALSVMPVRRATAIAIERNICFIVLSSYDYLFLSDERSKCIRALTSPVTPALMLSF